MSVTLIAAFVPLASRRLLRANPRHQHNHRRRNHPNQISVRFSSEMNPPHIRGPINFGEEFA